MPRSACACSLLSSPCHLLCKGCVEGLAASAGVYTEHALRYHSSEGKSSFFPLAVPRVVGETVRRPLLQRVALDVADAQIVAEGVPGQTYLVPLTQSASVFHSGSSCVCQCFPPG